MKTYLLGNRRTKYSLPVVYYNNNYTVRRGCSRENCFLIGNEYKRKPFDGRRELEARVGLGNAQAFW